MSEWERYTLPYPSSASTYSTSQCSSYWTCPEESTLTPLIPDGVLSTALQPSGVSSSGWPNSYSWPILVSAPKTVCLQDQILGEVPLSRGAYYRHHPCTTLTSLQGLQRMGQFNSKPLRLPWGMVIHRTRDTSASGQSSSPLQRFSSS